mgnify:CR=1 FL=1
MKSKYQVLDKVNFPSDIKKLSIDELKIFSEEVRKELIDAVSVTGGHLGAGLGVVVWFMDPLNPSVTLKSTVKNGFMTGTALGALFGFYMLQNAIIVPSESTLPENLDQLLGKDDLLRPIQSSIISLNEIKSVQNFRLPIFGFRF